MYRMVLLFGLVLAGFVQPSFADDRDDCVTGTKVVPDLRMTACTKAMEAKDLDPPTLAGFYRWRGLAFAEKGDGDRAIADFTEALRRDPHDARAYAGRGDAWDAKGDGIKAMADYNASLRLRFDAGVYGRRGLQWLARGAYSTAIDDFARGIALDPGNASLFSSRGQLWEKKGDVDRARADYDESVRLGSGDSTVYRNRAVFLLKRGDPDGAIADLDEAIRRNPADGSAFVHRGFVLARTGDFARPFADFNEAVRLAEKNSHAHFGRGIAAFFLGRFDAAAADFADAHNLKQEDFYREWSMAPAWRYLALARNGALIAALRGVPHEEYPGTWEYAVLEFLAGQMSEGSLLQQTTSRYDPPVRAVQFCQYDFFVGQRRLLDAKPADARVALQSAADNCPKGMLEYAAAVAELRRLGPE